MKFPFLIRRRRVCFKGRGFCDEDAETGVGGAEGMNKEGMLAKEDMSAM